MIKRIYCIILLTAWVILGFSQNSTCESGDCYNGFGSKTYSNGDKYTGIFKDEKRHGIGIYLYKHGDVYEGEFTDHEIKGKGAYIFVTGKKYIGEWEGGIYNGYGIFYDTSGGIIAKGTWENGEVVSEYYIDPFNNSGFNYDMFCLKLNALTEGIMNDCNGLYFPETAEQSNNNNITKYAPVFYLNHFPNGTVTKINDNIWKLRYEKSGSISQEEFDKLIDDIKNCIGEEWEKTEDFYNTELSVTTYINFEKDKSIISLTYGVSLNNYITVEIYKKLF